MSWPVHFKREPDKSLTVGCCYVEYYVEYCNAEEKDIELYKKKRYLI